MNTISGMGRGYNDYSSLFAGNSSKSSDIMNGISFSELINSLSGKLYNHTGSYYRSNYVTKIDKAV